MLTNITLPMRGRSPENWNVNEERFRTWLGSRSDILLPAVRLDQPSLKSLAALVLLDNGEHFLSYSSILEYLVKKRILETVGRRSVQEALEVQTLRVAISELSRALKHGRHRFQVRAIKVGRSSKFQISQPEPNRLFTSFAPATPGSRVHRDPINDPRTIAKLLVQNGGGLPFSSYYAIYRAAAIWVYFSTSTSILKRKYEGDSVKQLGTLRRCNARRISVAGLAIGEGYGEAEVLERILRPKNPQERRQVDYLAVDSSDVLLLGHTKLIHEKFAKEIENGDLRFIPVLGDLYQLSTHIVRERALSTGDFFNSLEVVCTYFGNCLGNDENREWDFFRTILDAFPLTQHVEMLVGVSLVRHVGRHGTIAEENYTMHPFLLETPRHLMHDLGLLISLDQKNNPIKPNSNNEFSLDPCLPSNDETIPSADYKTQHGVSGKVYRFFYQLRNRLTDYSRENIIDRGGRIHLFSIVKYNLSTLTDLLITMGLAVTSPSRSEILTIGEGNEIFRYAVFAVTRSSKQRDHVSLQ